MEKEEKIVKNKLNKTLNKSLDNDLALSQLKSKSGLPMMWIEVVTSFFYLGKSPIAPGSIGTIGAIPLVYVLSLMGDRLYLSLTFLICILSIPIVHQFENLSDIHDSKEIVIDEVVGFLVTMALLPMTWQALSLGFLIFRFFDILKPFPIGLIDRKVKGGLGVVADDIVAGIISNIILHYLYTNTIWLGERFVS